MIIQARKNNDKSDNNFVMFVKKTHDWSDKLYLFLAGANAVCDKS